MLDHSHLIDFLRCVHSKSELSSLISSGLLYNQISQLISIAIEEKYIFLDGDELTITESGIALIHNTKSITGYREGWVRADISRKIAKKEMMEIYLPSKSVASRLPNATSTSGLVHGGDESSS